MIPESVFTVMVRSPSKIEELEKIKNNYSRPIGRKLYLKYFYGMFTNK